MEFSFLCYVISWSKCGELMISKSQVGLGDVVDAFEKHGKKNRKGSGKQSLCGLGLKAPWTLSRLSD